MKKEFTAPVMEITKWDNNDVIATSASLQSFDGDLGGSTSSCTNNNSEKRYGQLFQ